MLAFAKTGHNTKKIQIFEFRKINLSKKDDIGLQSVQIQSPNVTLKIAK